MFAHDQARLAADNAVLALAVVRAAALVAADVSRPMSERVAARRQAKTVALDALAALGRVENASEAAFLDAYAFEGTAHEEVAAEHAEKAAEALLRAGNASREALQIARGITL
jgi:hypothetical protein